MRALTGDSIALVADPAAALIGRLRLATEDVEVDHLIARPATFVIDHSGVVRYRYLSRAPEDRPKAALLLLAAEQLAAGEHA